MELEPGTMVGRYRAEQRLAVGGIGEVWMATENASGRQVALKRLLPKVAGDRDVVARFDQEATLLGRIHSEFVVRRITYLREEAFGRVLAMELVPGEAL